MSVLRDEFAGRLIITWPKAATHPVPGFGVAFTDADSGKAITAATDADIIIHADPQHVVTATMTMVVDADGKPLTADATLVPDDDGENIRTAVFVWLVAEMRIAA